MKRTQVVKFYLSDKVNKSKKEKIIEFLTECQTVENYLMQYYWEHFDVIIKTNSKINMNYNNNINFKDTVPILKSHHFYTVLRQTYEQLKSIEVKIIKSLHFKLEDKFQQRMYNYCKGFCFQWDNLNKAIEKQIKKNKNDSEYNNFLELIKEYIFDGYNFIKMKQDIEEKFWETKSKFKLPQKKEFQIWVDTWLTTVIEKKEFQWFFIIDNNIKISPKKYDNIVIPVKYSDYHKNILENKTLKNSFNLKLNRYGNIEISAVYELEIDYPKNEIKDEIGIDIGLKKLITTSDGEIIDQNTNIVKKVKEIVKRQSNRDTLEKHLQDKYNNIEYKLSNKRYLLNQNKISDFIKTDNRYKVKSFLKYRLDTHIIMEDLNIGYSRTYNKEVNNMLKRMGVQRIKNDLLSYGKKMGIKISLVNPAFTSQTCPNCGHVSKNNRKTQETFCCEKCGHIANADVNASINIRNRYYDNRIDLNTPHWKIKKILLNE